MIPSKNTIKTNVKFAQEVYKSFLNRKHGIGSCCGVELDRYYTKKENCDLAHRILDGYCMAEPVIPVPPDCPVECIEGSYATAYFNLIGLSYPIDITAPTSYLTFIFNGNVIGQITINRSLYYSFSDPTNLLPFIDNCNQQLLFNLIPLTLSFAETIPGAMGYGFVLTTNDKTDTYNNTIASIQLNNLGSSGDYYDLNFESTISGGVVSTC